MDHLLLNCHLHLIMITILKLQINNSMIFFISRIMFFEFLKKQIQNFKKNTFIFQYSPWIAKK